MHLRKAIYNQKGFTLVELLVVVAIIAVLASAMVPKFQGYTNKARVSRTMADLATMKSIVEVYYADEGKGFYPGINNDANTEGSIAKVLQDKGVNWTGDEEGVKDPWGTPYRYGTAPNDRGMIDQEYVFQSAGHDKEFDTEDDIWCSSKRSTVQQGNLGINVDGWVYSAKQ